MNRVFVSGSTGAIGIALIKECIEQGIEVYAMCRKDSKRIKRIPDNKLVHIVECNLEHMKELAIADIKKCDVFYHLGWTATIGDGRNDMELQVKNIQYTLDAVELAEKIGCNTFIGAGSQAEYGRVEGQLNASTPTFPENGYGMAKVCAGQMSRVECRKRNMNHIWTRILSVYGPGDSELTMISSTIRKILDGNIPELTKGEQQWDYLYSDDAARAFILLGKKGIDGKIYCLGSGRARKLIEYIEKIRDAIDPKAELAIGAVPYSPKQVMYLCADITDLQQDTGFSPQMEFEEGIRKTINSIKNEYKVR